MRKIKQINRPFAVVRTMPYGANTYTNVTCMEAAVLAIGRLPKKQLPAFIKELRGVGYVTVHERLE